MVELRRALGRWDLTAIGVNQVIGAAIFILPADVARLAQVGPGGRLHFARCGLDIALELRRHVRERLETAMRGIAWEYGK